MALISKLTSFVSQNDWENTLGIFSATGVFIRVADTYWSLAHVIDSLAFDHTGVNDLDADFALFRRRHLYVLNNEGLFSCPSDRGFASNDFSCCAHLVTGEMMQEIWIEPRGGGDFIADGRTSPSDDDRHVIRTFTINEYVIPMPSKSSRTTQSAP